MKSFSTLPPEHARFNNLLDKLRPPAAWARQLADAAYAIAGTECTGPKRALLRIADAAAAFADAVSRTKPL